MNGKQEFEMKLNSKINNLLAANQKYLASYYHFIGMNRTLDTKYQYLLSVSLFVRSVGKDIDNLEMDDFTTYISNLYGNKSSSYAIQVYAALKLFGKYLYASHKLEYDPMEYVERPKYKETKEMLEKREKGFLTKEEIKQVKYNINHGVGSSVARGRQEPFRNRDMLMVLIFLSTGMRCSALMRLDVKDINPETMELSVYDKGDKINSYKLAESIREVLKDWLYDRERMLGDIQNEALFISRNKNRMSQSAIARVVTKYANIQGKHITPHKLRATYGTQMYMSTKDLYYTQQCMNHSNPKTTELYIRGNQRDVAKAADIMDKILK